MRTLQNIFKILVFTQLAISNGHSQLKEERKEVNPNLSKVMLEEKSSSPNVAAAGWNSSIEQPSTEMPVKDETKTSALHGELNETIVSIGKISGKLDELTTLMKEQFQRLKTVEQTIQIMESKMSEIPEVTSCGGVIEGNKGSIKYDLQLGNSISTTDYFTCTWTFRLISKHWIKLNLEAYTLGVGSNLTITPLYPMFTTKGTALLSQSTVYFTSKNNKTATLKGPVVFITLMANASPLDDSPQGFQLSFEGVDIGQALTTNFDDYTFSHYHFSELNGSFEYPAIIGKQFYSNKEIVTVTISNFANHLVTMNRIDLEDATSCQFDSITRFTYDDQSTYFRRNGRPPKDYRYCGKSNLSSELALSIPSIVVFKSDYSVVGTGFKISWTSTAQTESSSTTEKSTTAISSTTEALSSS